MRETSYWVACGVTYRNLLKDIFDIMIAEIYNDTDNSVTLLHINLLCGYELMLSFCLFIDYCDYQFYGRSLGRIIEASLRLGYADMMGNQVFI